MKNRPLVFLVGITVLATAGFFIWKSFRPAAAPATAGAGAAAGPGGGAAKPAGGGGRPPAPPLSVTGVRINPQPFQETIAANGTLRAEESIELQTEVNGKVIALNFQEGQRVQKGDVLLKIDDSTLRASLRRAEARQALSRFRERRIARLVAEGGVSKLEYDEALGELDVLAAEADIIRADIAKTEIRAPFDGVVGIRFISIGSYVNPATRIATLQGIARLKVDFSVPERYASAIKPGSTMSFSVAGDPRTYTGEISAVEPRVDIATRSILLRAVCSNPDGTLLPGTFANVGYTIQESAEALLVPAIALISGLEERFLFVEQGGVAKRIPVIIGVRTTTHVQIIKGLAPGTLVITSGIQQLRPGQAVKVTEQKT